MNEMTKHKEKHKTRSKARQSAVVMSGQGWDMSALCKHGDRDNSGMYGTKMEMET